MKWHSIINDAIILFWHCTKLRYPSLTIPYGTSDVTTAIIASTIITGLPLKIMHRPIATGIWLFTVLCFTTSLVNF